MGLFSSLLGKKPTDFVARISLSKRDPHATCDARSTHGVRSEIHTRHAPLDMRVPGGVAGRVVDVVCGSRFVVSLRDPHTKRDPHTTCSRVAPHNVRVPGGVPSRARFEQQNRCVSFRKDLKRGPYRLRFQAEAAFQTQRIA